MENWADFPFLRHFSAIFPHFPVLLWCFRFLGLFVAAKFLGLFECFRHIFQCFLRVRKVRRILGVFEVFLGIFKKTKEKKDTVRVKIITGSLVALENLFPRNDRYRYRLEIQMS